MARLRAADEQPVFATDRDGFHGAFGGVVVDAQVAVLDVTVQSLPLVAGVGCGLGDDALREELLAVGPRLEIGQQRCGVLGAQALAGRLREGVSKLGIALHTAAS